VAVAAVRLRLHPVSSLTVPSAAISGVGLRTSSRTAVEVCELVRRCQGPAGAGA
jgi:hypothetical protein